MALGLPFGFALGGCSKEPPDLPSGHLAWLDEHGAVRLTLRAKPYGYRIALPDGRRWGRIERVNGEVRLSGPAEAIVVARQTSDGVTLVGPSGELRAIVRPVDNGFLILDRAAAPLGRLVRDDQRVTAYTAGGLPVGVAERGETQDAAQGTQGNTSTRGAPGTTSARRGTDNTTPMLFLRARTQAVVGTLLGSGSPEHGAVLLLEDLPLEDRLALLALWEGKQQPVP